MLAEQDINAGPKLFDQVPQKEHEILSLAQFSLDHAADAVFWITPDARFVYVNKAACESLGYSSAELLTMTVHDIDPDFPSDIWPEHWQQIRQKGSFTFESHHRTKDGKIFPVEISVNYLEFDGREYNCAFVRNIAERKKDFAVIKCHYCRVSTLFGKLFRFF